MWQVDGTAEIADLETEISKFLARADRSHSVAKKSCVVQ